MQVSVFSGPNPLTTQGRFMKIKSIKIKNYKCYEETQSILLSEDWNIIVGKNNSGKTAIIETLSGSRFQNKPHLSEKIPFGVTPNHESYIIVSAFFDGKEIQSIVRNHRRSVTLPIPENKVQGHEEFGRTIIEDGVTLKFEILSDGNIRKHSPESINDQAQSNQSTSVSLYYDNENSEYRAGITYGSDRNYEVACRPHIHSHTYVFDAKRSCDGSCQYEDTDTLRSDGRNLAAVIAKLNYNPARLAEFDKLVTTIFPSIHGVRSAQGRQGFEIRIWPIDPTTQRSDLTIPLDECGTGVGQVIAILYVALNQINSVIVIDEPNSFLNPGASKKLIEILKSYKNQQYIISTHSTDIISSLPNATIIEAKVEKSAGSVSVIDRNKAGYEISILEELGASLSDVFGSDRVIWVEGPTERECFYAIFESEIGHRPTDFTIAPMRATGDFEAKGIDANAALDLYAAISQGGSIVPKAIIFSFDPEGRSETQLSDISRRLKGQARFLPRMMIENYFLSPLAIEKLLTVRTGAAPDQDEISEIMKEFLNDEKILNRSYKKDLGDIKSITNVNGAKLLHKTILKASNNLYEYRKIMDGKFLLNEILSSEKKNIIELINYVLDLHQETPSTLPVT